MSAPKKCLPVPQMSQLVSIENEISTLRDRQAKILENIITDCEFMDVPLIRLESFEVAGDLSPGDLCHVLFIEEEANGYEKFSGHRSANCKSWMCELTGRTKYPKYAHVGSRYWATPQTDHVVVGVESYVNEKMFGRRARTRYVLAPVSQAKLTDRIEVAFEMRAELVGASA